MTFLNRWKMLMALLVMGWVSAPLLAQTEAPPQGGPAIQQAAENDEEDGAALQPLPVNPRVYHLNDPALSRLADRIADGTASFAERRAYFWLYQRLYPFDKPAPRTWRLKAEQAIQAMRPRTFFASAEGMAATALASTAWTPLGPTSYNDGFGDYVSGRATAIWVSASDKSHIMLGTADGGVWKTTDQGVNWTPIFDSAITQSIGSIGVDPNNPQVIYVGTGEGNYSEDVIAGVGIYKSTDGGSTWNILSLPTFPYTQPWHNVRRVVVDKLDSQKVYAAVDGGLLYSTNGGSNWTRTSCGATSSVILGDDLVLDSVHGAGGQSIVYVAFDGDGIYRSTTGGGGPWTKISSGGGFPSSGFSRITLVTAPSDPKQLYVLLADSSTKGSLGIFYTSDATASSVSWTAESAMNYCGKQARYDMTGVVDPSNPARLIVGGLDDYLSNDNGATLTQVSWWNQSGGMFSHADHHFFAMPDSTTLYDANDGGFFIGTINWSTPSNTSFVNRNATLNTIQFYGMAQHPTNAGLYIGGAQDNGEAYYNGSSWSEVYRGDGGKSAWDQVSPSYAYEEYVNGFIQRNANMASSPTSWTCIQYYGGCSCNDFACNPDGRTLFIAPFTLNPNYPNTLYVGSNRIWANTSARSGNGSWSPISVDLTGNSTDSVSYIHSAKAIGTVTIYAGTSNGKVWVTSDGGVHWTDITAGLPSAYLTSITTDPANGQHVLVTFSGYGSQHVFRSTNGGSSWTDITGGLPAEPYNCIALNPTDPNHAYVGSDFGVFEDTSVWTSSTWSSIQNNLPAVSVQELGFNVTNGNLRCATHGRGIWELSASSTLSAELAATPSSGFAPLGVTLTATASGSAAGTLNYSFWWDCIDPTISVGDAETACGALPNPPLGTCGGNPVGYKCNALADGTTTASTTAFTYTTVKTYTAKVIVEQGAAQPVQAQAIVTVSLGSTCTSFAISPASATVAAAEGAKPAAITGSPAGCQGGNWSAAGNGTWLVVSPTSGTGSGSVTVSWTQNPNSTSRSSSVTIAGSSFAVTQAGTSPVVPDPPFMLLPGSVAGGTWSNLWVPFSWLAVATADSYQLELSDASGVLATQTVQMPAVSFTFPSPLLDNHAYTWRMRSHNAAGWGSWNVPYSFNTYTGLTSGDFSLGASPTAGFVVPGGSAAFVLNTATVQGAAQALTLRAGNVPAAITAAFSSTSIQSGGQSTLTLSTAAAATPGFYPISVSATSNLGVTHAVTIGLTVNPPPTTGEPAVCLSPSSLAFADQMAGTSSSTQLVTLRNCGNGSLHISSLGASAEFFIGSGSFPVPLDLAAGGATTFQVGFSPLGAGPRTGDTEIVSNAPGSPTVLPLSGTGTPAPVTTGTVVIQATYNGQPWTGYVAICTLTWPSGSTMNFTDVPVTLTSQQAGTYSLAVSGSVVGGGTLAGIAPAASQTLAAGDSIVFTVNVNGTNDFGFSCPSSSYTGTVPPLVMPPSGSASVGVTAGYIAGGSQTVAFAATGLAPGTTATFNPSSAVLPGGGATTCSLSTTSSTPPGIFGITLGATNQDGLSHALPGFQVVAPPTTPRMASVGLGGALANGDTIGYTSLSADGRYLVFQSNASNLVSGDTNGWPDVFVRDLQTNTTSRVGVATDGTQVKYYGTYAPSISGDGKFAAFVSMADELVPGGGGGTNQVYIRDLLAGVTTMASVAPDGSPGNGESGCQPSLSGDGRYVAFCSSATNLVSSATGGLSQVFVRDLSTGSTAIVSLSNDGAPGDAASSMPVISGDGRYVAFLTSASNLVPGATAHGQQIFVHDTLLGTTELVSGAPDGVAADAGAYPAGSIAMTPDGRFVAFSSNASNLVSGDGNFGVDTFVRDRVTGTTDLVSVANDGLQLGGWGPSISADGRFVAYAVWAPNLTGQAIVWDRTMRRAVVYSVGPGSVLAGGATTLNTTGVSLSGDGRTLAFLTAATNLVAGDTNGFTDAFSVSLPTTGSTYVSSLALAPVSLPGGGVATGTVTLNGPAPTGGATVHLSSMNPSAQVPSIVTVSAGTTSATFAIPTLTVWKEQSVSVVASYGGASPSALLTLEPAEPARIDALDGDGQGAMLGATFATSFKARVVDATNNPMPDVVVEFLAPATGASGSFAGGSSSVFVMTDPSGTATATSFTANSVAGTYAIVALVSGVTVPATFEVSNESGEALTVTRAGLGAGTVTSSPAGIDCGPACSVQFAVGTPVTLTAAPAAGSTFTGWSGEGCLGTGTCQVTMSQARTVTAAFEQGPAGMSLYTVTPCRVFDTRNATGPLGGPAITTAERSFTVAGVCGIPATAKALAINATVTGGDTKSWIAIYPGDVAWPGNSNLNYLALQTRANNAVVSLAADGSGTIKVRCGAGSVHVLLDVAGYFQ